MNADDEWDLIQEERNSGLSETGGSVLRLALLFGSAAVAFALFLVPLMNRGGDLAFGNRLSAADLDQISTGSVSPSGEYVIRRSVLQRTPQSVCVIKANGGKIGDC